METSLVDTCLRRRLMDVAKWGKRKQSTVVVTARGASVKRRFVSRTRAGGR